MKRPKKYTTDTKLQSNTRYAIIDGVVYKDIKEISIHSMADKIRQDFGRDINIILNAP